MILKLKSSLAENDYEVSSSAADLASRKDAFFRLERKKAAISLIYDKLLARLRSHHKSAEKFKFEATIDAYKLGYLHCTNGIASFYAIEDGDIEALCSNLFLVQSEQVNVVNMEGTEEAVATKDGAEEDVANEMAANVAEQADGAAEGVADQADAEEAVYQGFPVGVS